MVFVSLYEIVPKTTFWVQNKNQHAILNPCVKFELNWLINKSYRKTSVIFEGMSGLNSVLKLEMTSYSDNAYDITIFFCFLYSIATKFHCQTPNGRVELGAPPPPLVHYRGILGPVQNKVKVQMTRKFLLSYLEVLEKSGILFDWKNDRKNDTEVWVKINQNW